MSSTAATSDTPMTLRSSRQLKILELIKQPTIQINIKTPPTSIHSPSQRIEPQKQQQTKQKIEKESTSAPHAEVPSVCNPQAQSKRVTRSSVMQVVRISPEIDLRHDLATPEGESSVKASEQVTCKKAAQFSSVQCFSQNKIQEDQCLTIRKVVPKVAENDPYSYSDIRKSYRKNHKGDLQSVPYRKCHDALQGRIVTIINKMVEGRSCNKDFEGLIQRIQKITTKDMMNRFIISGIRLMLKISKQKDIYDNKIIERLRHELQQVQHKVVEELARTDLYQHTTSYQNQPILDTGRLKHTLIRRIYKIIKNKENRETAISDCEKILKHDINLTGLVKFIKNKMEIPL